MAKVSRPDEARCWTGDGHDLDEIAGELRRAVEGSGGRSARPAPSHPHPPIAAARALNYVAFGYPLECCYDGKSVMSIIRRICAAMALACSLIAQNSYAAVVRIVCSIETTGETLRYALDTTKRVALSGTIDSHKFPKNVPMRVTDDKLDWGTTMPSGTVYQFSPR
jgi:hypothetical protein